MERPSHSLSTLSWQSGSRRIAGAGITVIAQLAFIAAFIGGVVVRVSVHPPLPIEVSKLDTVRPEMPPPPLPKAVKPIMPSVDAPVIDIAPPASDGAITMVTPQVTPIPPVPTRQPPVTSVPDRAATAVPETHTSPPYPSLARRLGAEGKVTLRLIVLPDGSVGKAEVVTSSGRQDLDQTAQQWIVGHWTYRPAIRDGAPAASQILAAVQFSLTSAQ